MKKIITIILLAAALLSMSTIAFADDVGNIQSDTFTTVKIPFPDSIKDNDSWLTRARYKDTGEIIPLSMSYENSVYATIPVENNTQDDCQMYASELALMFGFDKEMPAIDGSTSTYPFTEAGQVCVEMTGYGRLK